MTVDLDETHDPARRSWVATANRADAAFPIQNLPLGIFSPSDGAPRAGVAIGDQILDLAAGVAAGLIDDVPEAMVAGDTLNALLALGADHATGLRRRLGQLLDASTAPTAHTLLHPAAQCRLHLPARIGDYTDFFAGIHHASAAGALMRPDNPLTPNYKYVPIAYHGRASSVRPSGAVVSRPNGQRVLAANTQPVFGPSQRLDVELELGFFIGRGNAPGVPIPIAAAAGHIAGYCLLNDWSARDVQRWEMAPLGPFLAKNFATTISPWIVTADALRPFRVPAMVRPDGDPAPLDYLADAADQARGGLDITLEIRLATAAMQAQGLAAEVVATSNACHLYWTPAQMVAHHASGGCDLRPGDLLGSGTISGPAAEQRGSLLELTQGGRAPLVLSTGERRSFLEDGDLAELHGICRRAGFVSIGFGPCTGLIVPAP